MAPIRAASPVAVIIAIPLFMPAKKGVHLINALSAMPEAATISAGLLFNQKAAAGQ